MRNVVEYEKKTGKKEEEKKDDKAHVKSEEFLKAIKLLSKDEGEN